MDLQFLMKKAKSVAENSYSPYSHFRVGAALLSKDGDIFCGTNVENRSFGLTICAERSAISMALSQGVHEFVAIAVYCPDADYAVSPCGACRQVLSEFVAKDFTILFQGAKGDAVSRRMEELLPDDSLDELKEK
ncbi:cytidine deaminase [Oceanispirochaeta crateris]|uniref:Cytidine deaminase n=1 Tax=Oceanispirochaeta crateris TaxID=2518645 RepID=A0A5C1QKB4_9SPIO|nr:cytidine deaminase [Oceanispirochaeta crateris]QEN07917.1 cytidine deaminase [Oceanispirochaeta crateris]